MDFMERLSIPRRLSPRLWLVTIPSAVVSFEKRSDVPPLPIGKGRYLGLPLLAAAAALAAWSIRQPKTTIAYDGPLAPAVRKPATLAGLLGLGGLSLLLRSTALCLYATGLAFGAGTGKLEIEEPSSSTLIGR